MKLNKVIYEIESLKLNKSHLLAVLSDLNYQDEDDIKFLIKIALDLKEMKPDVICITGDLFLNIGYVKNYTSLIRWLDIISKIAPVCLVKGDKDNLTNNEYFDSSIIFEKISKLPKVVLLDYPYSKIRINDLVFTGFDLKEKSKEYYIDKKESVSSYLELVRDKINLIENSLNPNDYNILLFHSPNVLFNDLNHPKFSLYLAGHNLNGKTPEFIDFLTGNSSYGLINSQKKLLAKHCRNCENLNHDDLYGLNCAPAILGRKKCSIRYLELKEK